MEEETIRQNPAIGFKKIYRDEDFLKALEGLNKPINTAQVKERLEALDPLYKGLHYDWCKKTLQRLAREGKVEIVEMPKVRMYFWKAKGKKG